jgi:hypothetical protein
MRVSAISMGALALWAASMAWSGSTAAVTAPVKAPVSVPVKSAKSKSPSPQVSSANVAFADEGNLEVTVSPSAETAPAAPKPTLADAFIAQTVLRVYLNRPATLFVFNSRGQQIFHLDSQRPMEAVPLLGMSTGFIYLTVRTAQGEMTKKLVFTGK